MLRRQLQVLLVLLALGTVAVAEEEIIPLPMDPGDNGEEVEAPLVQPATKAQTDAACKKYEGRFIGYYGRVFRIEKCKKRPVEDADAIYQITLKKNVIVGVDASVVSAIPDGLPLLDKIEMSKPRSCKQVSGSYLTHNFNDMYYMDGCKLLEFPDYETYIDHRKQHKALKSEVVSISYSELRSFGKTKVLTSIMDSKEARMASAEAPIEVIPIDVACKGVNDQYVTFFSLMYKIERCRKRPVDPERVLWKFSGKVKLKELTSEQWISIPDGQPLKM